jgi:hypothetical protein
MRPEATSVRGLQHIGVHARLEMSARLELSIAASAGAMRARLEMSRGTSAEQRVECACHE